MIEVWILEDISPVLVSLSNAHPVITKSFAIARCIREAHEHLTVFESEKLKLFQEMWEPWENNTLQILPEKQEEFFTKLNELRGIKVDVKLPLLTEKDFIDDGTNTVSPWDIVKYQMAYEESTKPLPPIKDEVVSDENLEPNE